MHRNPSTLEEAVQDYAQILALTNPPNESLRTTKEIDAEMDKAEGLGLFEYGLDEDLIWELKREKFILQVRDRYREVMADMVMEERCNPA